MASESSSSVQRVALCGNPNTGKTTLFNALTGAQARTGNYPGVTVDRRVGRLRGRDDVEIIDVPGTYSLTARSVDEQIALDVIVGLSPDAVTERAGSEPARSDQRNRGDRPALLVVCVDATQLARSSYLVLQA